MHTHAHPLSLYLSLLVSKSRPSKFNTKTAIEFGASAWLSLELFSGFVNRFFFWAYVGLPWSCSSHVFDCHRLQFNPILRSLLDRTRLEADPIALIVNSRSNS